MKNVVVIAGAGFLGSAIVTKLSNAGYAVKVLTRRRENAKHLILLPNVQVENCDVLDSHALKTALKGAQIAINCLGILHENGQNSFEKVHHQLPRTLAHLCEELGVKRLVHISALKAHAHAPSQYLRSKAAGEAALLEFSKRLQLTIFQPSVVFGRHDKFLNLFATLAQYSPFIPLAKSQAKFQPIWVEDVAQAVLNALENTACYGKIYPLGGPGVFTLRQLLEKVMAQLQISRPIIPLNDMLSYAQAAVMEWLPIKLMSRDNVRSMQVANVLDAPVAPELGLNLTDLESQISDYIGKQNTRQRYEDYRRAAGRAINARR